MGILSLDVETRGLPPLARCPTTSCVCGEVYLTLPYTLKILSQKELGTPRASRDRWEVEARGGRRRPQPTTRTMEDPSPGDGRCRRRGGGEQTRRARDEGESRTLRRSARGCTKRHKDRTGGDLFLFTHLLVPRRGVRFYLFIAFLWGYLLSTWPRVVSEPTVFRSIRSVGVRNCTSYDVLSSVDPHNTIYTRARSMTMCIVAYMCLVCA